MQRELPKNWSMHVVNSFVFTCRRGAMIVENLIEYTPEMAAFHLQARNNRKWESYKWICKQVERQCMLNDETVLSKQWIVDRLNARWAQKY